MRTTVSLDANVARAVDELRKDGMGTSEAINALARRGLTRGDPPRPFTQRASSMGPPRVPLDDVAAALDALEGEQHRG